jgi:hypothetical protein
MIDLQISQTRPAGPINPTGFSLAVDAIEFLFALNL